MDGTRLADESGGRRTPLRRWLIDLSNEVRMLSAARKLALALAGLGTLAFATWLTLGVLRESGFRTSAATGLPDVAAARDVPASPVERAEGEAVGPRDLERELRLERELAARAESLLAHAVGAGRVAVRVRAELDWSQREETREAYDPDGQVERSEDRTVDGAGAGKTGTGRSIDHVEYDVGKQVTRALTPPGALQRLHVAVLVDGKPGAGAESGRSFTPWSAAELAQLETLAKQAVGFSADRGDELILTSAPFRAAAPPRISPELWSLVTQLLAYAAGLIGLAVVVFGALRALEGTAALADLPMSAGALEAELLAREGFALEAAAGETMMGRRSPEIARAHGAGDDRDAAAATVRAWLRER